MILCIKTGILQNNLSREICCFLTVMKCHTNVTKERKNVNITDIKIRRIYTEGKLRAMVSITIDGALAVHDIKVIEGPERLFVAMPSRKEESGTFRDIVHPISKEARQNIEDLILEEYHKRVAQAEAEAEMKAAQAEDNDKDISDNTNQDE